MNIWKLGTIILLSLSVNTTALGAVSATLQASFKKYECRAVGLVSLLNIAKANGGGYLSDEYTQEITKTLFAEMEEKTRGDWSAPTPYMDAAETNFFWQQVFAQDPTEAVQTYLNEFFQTLNGSIYWDDNTLIKNNPIKDAICILNKFEEE